MEIRKNISASSNLGYYLKVNGYKIIKSASVNDKGNNKIEKIKSDLIPGE